MADDKRWRSTAPCGDRIERNGDELVIDAVFPIADLEVSKFRKPILLMRDERFTLTAVEGHPKRPTYRFVVDKQNLYEPGGKEIAYDGNRHLERRSERRRVALAWILWFPLVPLMPFLGLLPQGAKDKLVNLGIDPGRATRLSVNLQWLLLVFLVVAYFASGGFFTLPGAFIGALTLLTGLDICYRVTADADHKQPGAYAVVGESIRFIKDLIATARGKDRLVGDQPPPQISGNDSKDDA